MGKHVNIEREVWPIKRVSRSNAYRLWVEEFDWYQEWGGRGRGLKLGNPSVPLGIHS
jgi:hypothetical protein